MSPPRSSAAAEPRTGSGRRQPGRWARRQLLAAVATEVRGCTRCPLHRGRTNAVPGEGNPISRRAAGGRGSRCPRGCHRAPVRRSGRPAARASCSRSLGWAREDVFIANVVKCRPPGNRDPEPDEICGLRRLPRPPGGGARSGRDRHAGSPLAGPIPARCPHLGACTASCVDRAAASSSRCTILLRRCTRPRCERRSSRDIRGLPAALLAARAGARGGAGGIGPGGDARSPEPAPVAGSDETDQMTLF